MIVGKHQRRVVYAVTAALWTTGALDWALDVWPQGPRAWGPRLLALHGLAALVFLVAFGSLWPLHVWRAWRAAANRWSGAAVFGWAVVMAASGWGLYYSGSEALRAALRAGHLWLGLGIPILLVAHVVLGRAWRRRFLAARQSHSRAHLGRSADQP